LQDIKKTMAEVAANIESRVTYEDQRRQLDDKVSKTEIGFYMQEKVSFEDLKNYLNSNGGGLNGGMGGQSEEFAEELIMLRKKLDDTYHQVQGLLKIGGGPSSARDFSTFQS